jgi:hypothetical protein
LHGINGRQIAATAGRSLVGILPMAAVAYGVYQAASGGSLAHGPRVLGALLLAVVLGAMTYFLVEWLLRSEEIAVAFSVVRRDRARLQ